MGKPFWNWMRRNSRQWSGQAASHGRRGLTTNKSKERIDKWRKIRKGILKIKETSNWRYDRRPQRSVFR